MKFYYIFFIIVLLSANSTYGQEKISSFKDSTDLAFDISDFLITKKGILPVPVIITEPAVGYGAAFALIYFHDSYENKAAPPSITGAFGGLTENGTWMGGAFHAGFWKQDRIRYLGAVGKVNVNIDYYGSLKDPAEFNMNAWLLIQQIQFRIIETDFFLGARYNFIPAKNAFKLPIDIPEYTGTEFETNISELSALLIYDSRNNVISPTKGFWVQVAPVYSNTWLGGDSEYGKINSSAMGFFPFAKKFVAGGRLMADSKFGDIPFYIRPFVQLRGVPLFKYQDNNILSFEAELDWNVYKRWHLIGFAGYGSAFDQYSNLSEGNDVFSGGAGFRYLLARKFGMKMGMDFAFSPDEFAFYIVMGHSWVF